MRCGTPSVCKEGRVMGWGCQAGEQGTGVGQGHWGSGWTYTQPCPKAPAAPPPWTALHSRSSPGCALLPWPGFWVGGNVLAGSIHPPAPRVSGVFPSRGSDWDALGRARPTWLPPQGTRRSALAQRCQLPRMVVCLSEMLLVKPGSGLASEVTEHEDRLPLRHTDTQQRQWCGGPWQLSRFWNVLSRGGQAWPSGRCAAHETSDEVLKP